MKTAKQNRIILVIILLNFDYLMYQIDVLGIFCNIVAGRMTKVPLLISIKRKEEKDG